MNEATTIFLSSAAADGRIIQTNCVINKPYHPIMSIIKTWSDKFARSRRVVCTQSTFFFVPSRWAKLCSAQYSRERETKACTTQTEALGPEAWGLTSCETTCRHSEDAATEPRWMLQKKKTRLCWWVRRSVRRHQLTLRNLYIKNESARFILKYWNKETSSYFI